jgi:MSHA type pilus biogenesis protein MshL
MGNREELGAACDLATRPSKQRGAARRHIVPTRVLPTIALMLIVLSELGCAYKPTVPPSQGHINAEQFPPKTADEKILPPVTVSNLVPQPRPQVKVPTYSVVVQEVPVKELLFALSRDTKQNIDVHPGVQGRVTLNAIDETLPAILDRLAKQVDIRYHTEGKTVIVEPDTPFLRTYRVNYVNMTRDTTSTIGVSGEISSGTASSTGTGGAGATGGGAAGGNSSSTTVNTSSKNDFWELLRQNVQSILSSSKAQTTTAEQRATRAEALRTERETRLAQAEAVARAGAGATTLFATAFGGSQQTPLGDLKNDIVVNPVAGTVGVMATEKQHALVQQYLDGVTASVQRQVLIEATIAEVQLSNNYQAGVDWSRLALSGGVTFQQQLLGANLGAAPRMIVGYSNPTSPVGNLSTSIRLLEQFGNTRVLSSPKLMALNNQTALLKVVDNVVYFTVQAQTTSGTAGSPSLTTFNTTAQIVPVGVIVSLTPQINDSGMVNITVRPTISRITSFVNDPNPSLQVGPTGLPLANPIQNQVPQIQVREMESVLQVGSGQTVILGGLMQDSVQRDRDQVPGLGSIPRIGEAFSFRNEKVSKTELVIFLKPTVISNPSLDSDELKFFQRFLPVVDKTGKNP